MRLPFIPLTLAVLALATTTAQAEDFASRVKAGCLKATANDQAFRGMTQTLGKDVSRAYCDCAARKANAFSAAEKKELTTEGVQPSPAIQQKLSDHARACINEVVPD